MFVRQFAKSSFALQHERVRLVVSVQEVNVDYLSKVINNGTRSLQVLNNGQPTLNDYYLDEY